MELERMAASWSWQTLLLAMALVLDTLWGEPPARFHPVVWMGKAISVGGRLLGFSPQGRVRPLREGLGGALLALAVPLLFAVAAAAMLALVSFSPLLSLALGAYLLKSSFALRELGRSGRAVGAALRAGHLPQARHGLRSLCSRDAAALDAEEVAGAAIESVAENASDSFVAPLFYFALFGVPGAIFYRAVNTLDAMIGYRGRTEYWGKGAARLDDLLNYLPARFTTLCLLLAGASQGKDIRRAWHILRRDGARTPSPNAGRPMALMAGLLGLELTKRGVYRLGDAREAATAEKIDESWRLVEQGAAFAAAFTFLLMGIRYVVSL